MSMLGNKFVGKKGGKFAHSDGYSVGLDNVSGISISIASPEDILSWSSGEVKKSETISYRTYRPENDGLFSARIFGPTRDYECQCGKYRRVKYKGIVCEKCGVEITTSRIRRERLGHIELASPVAHCLFLRRSNSPISVLLGMTMKEVEKILYFESYMVIDPGNTTLKYKQILSESDYRSALDEFGNSFTVGSGAEVIRDCLAVIDVEKEVEEVSKGLSETKSESKKRNLLRKLHILRDFLRSKNRPEWMILSRIPVLPPDLRPLVQLDGGRFVSSDLNELYRRVIDRNERLRRMVAVRAPLVIINNEKRMLQEAVSALFDNSKKVVSARSSVGRVLKSLSDYLKGKQGRFRQNLLGKRVDYSGRSVIMVGPSLRLYECGLPKIMALELFKPFIFGKLLMYGKVSSVRMAKKMVDNQMPEVWDILEEVIDGHPVLLNRAPTLHRLNIQAFQPKLIEAKAIQLHPLVCKAFNADFDGDQMAVHVPLSIEAQMEAWVLMLSANNILSPQNGKPVIIPTKDMVVGLYCMTAMVERQDKGVKSFDSYSDVLFALYNGAIKINSKIRYYCSYVSYESGLVQGNAECHETTAGRIMIYNLVPNDGRVMFDKFNITINSKNIPDLLGLVHSVYGQTIAVEFADGIKSLGFEYSTKAGVSFGKDDMIIPDTKKKHIEETMEKIKLAERQYAEGYITFREKYNQVTDRWSECTDRVARDMMEEIAKTKDSENVNSVYVMMLSGARVSEPVMRQIAGMRGLIAKPSGEIIEAPIISNFKEGMTVLEYFNSAHGARKGAADTALKTADAGYLTRRLVDVSQDCVITMHDCNTEEGIEYFAKIEDGKISNPLSSVVFGRVLCGDVFDSRGNKVLERGSLIDHRNTALLDDHEILSAKIRSPVMCASKDGICAVCYGSDPAIGALVNIGEVVGIVAAQSIGEPSAQLTMNTFHIGGATSRSVQKSYMESLFEGRLSFVDLGFVINQEKEKIVISNSGHVVVKNKDGVELTKYSIPYGAKLLVSDGANVGIGEKIATWDPYNDYIVCEYDGFIKMEDMVPGVSFKERSDDMGWSQRIITDWSQVDKSLNPRISILDSNGNNVRTSSGIGVARYVLPVDAILSIRDGDKIHVGTVVARIPKESVQAVKDITGGLPRVEDIFEARVPKEPAIIAEIDGVAEFVNDYKNRHHLKVRAVNGTDNEAAYNIPRGKHIKVQEGSYVKKGDIIVDGRLDPHDILAVQGIGALTRYIVAEVQQVYGLQGVHIDNKHIEIIVKYMLQKVEIIDRGDVSVIGMQQCDFDEVESLNNEAIAAGMKPATYKRVLQGITRATIKNSSFISAASFQETTRVLTEAAIAGKKDPLKGMKENIIVGRLMQAGTGYIASMIKNLHIPGSAAIED